MKTEKVIWGIILVFIGCIILLENFELIDFSWEAVLRFWPVVLIMIGANLLFTSLESRYSGIMSISLSLIALGFITYKGITAENEGEEWSFNRADEHVDAAATDNFTEEYSDSIRTATLRISGGATEYILRDSTSDLFSADVKRSMGRFSLLRTSTDSSHFLNFKMKGKTKFKFNDKRGNKAVIKLNTRPVWDIRMEMGAGSAKFDLSAFKIKNLALEGGAASFEIKLGEPVMNTSVSVETGASSVEILIPRSAPCKIKVDSGLSSDDFKGFTRQSDGTYTNAEYKAGTNAILLNLEGGLSSFSVNQY